MNVSLFFMICEGGGIMSVISFLQAVILQYCDHFDSWVRIKGSANMLIFLEACIFNNISIQLLDYF